MGEGDAVDLEMAKQAYAIVRGGNDATRSLPHWLDLPEGMRVALQFAVAHAILNERAACLNIAKTMDGDFIECDANGDGYLEARKAIAEAIRTRT